MNDKFKKSIETLKEFGEIRHNIHNTKYGYCSKCNKKFKKIDNEWFEFTKRINSMIERKIIFESVLIDIVNECCNMKDDFKNDMTLNEYIKFEIKKRKLKVDVLANILGYKRSTLYWKLDNEERLSFFEAILICNHLDIDMSDIQRIYREPRKIVASEKLDDLKEKMLNRYKGLCYEFYVNNCPDLLEGIWEVENVLFELGYNQEMLDKISQEIQNKKEITE